MSFVGDLEHLPIVDVIQLLHATRKSGTLCLKSTKGESQLVFNDGCIVSANHSNNSVRIGQILVQMNIISREELDATLAEQKNAGTNRVPLIAALIESGRIKKEDAFKGLETLIELTIVEVLTWTEGTFELDVEAKVVSDEYRYIPEKLKLDLTLNTQNVLMDALRIYDEKKRDGTLTEDTFPASEAADEEMSSSTTDDKVISIDDLGLDVLDDLEKVIPGFFTPVKVHDPSLIHREKIGKRLTELPPEEQEELLSLLMSYLETPDSQHNNHSSHALILYSGNEHISHMVISACKQKGLLVLSTDEEENLDHIIKQSISKGLQPVLVIDASGNGTESPPEKQPANLVTRTLDTYPDISILQLIDNGDYEAALAAMHSGIRAVLPKPDISARKSTFVKDTAAFLETLASSVLASPLKEDQKPVQLFRECIDTMAGLKELPEILSVIDRFVSMAMERSITFTLNKAEFVSEKLFVSGEPRPMPISFPADANILFQNALKEGNTFFGQLEDQSLTGNIHKNIDPPLSKQILLLPMKCLGRVLAITYGDFGISPQKTVRLELLEILVRHAGLAYENALYRKKFEKMLQTQN